LRRRAVAKGWKEEATAGFNDERPNPHQSKVVGAPIEVDTHPNKIYLEISRDKINQSSYRIMPRTSSVGVECIPLNKKFDLFRERRRPSA